jgi:hypothetical protein
MDEDGIVDGGCCFEDPARVDLPFSVTNVMM